MSTQISLTSGGSISLSGPNYLTVLANKTPAENGQAVKDAYAYAQTLTPNGDALSATNRFVILLAPGYYSFSEGIIGDSFHVTTSFIDFESLSGQRDVYFSSINVYPTDSNGLDIRFSGIDTTKNNYYYHGAFAIATNGGSNEHVVAINCKGGDFSFGSFSNSFVGRFENCEAGSYSFLCIPPTPPQDGITGFITGPNVINLGSMYNCTAVDFSFCVNGFTDASGGSAFNYGIISHCKANDYSFVTGADNVYNYNTISNCTARINSICMKNDPSDLFSGYVINSATIDNCYAIESSICFSNRVSGGYNFVQNYGIITQCTVEGAGGICSSATQGAVNYGKIIYCYAYSTAFCSNFGYNVGYIIDCIANDNAFCSYVMANNNAAILRCTLMYDDFIIGATSGYFRLCLGGSTIVNS